MPVYVREKGSRKIKKINKIVTTDALPLYVFADEDEALLVDDDNISVLGDNTDAKIIYGYVTDENAVPTLVYEKPRTAFSVYSADDNSLTFYYNHTVPIEGDQYEDKTATIVYQDDFLNIDYTESDPPVWHEICNQIESVSFDESFAMARPIYIAYWFYEMANCTSMDIENLNTSQVIDMHDAFSGLENLESLDVSNLDVRNVECMYGTFYNCAKLTTIDVSNWQTDSLTDAHGVFDSCGSLESIDLTGWDTSKVTDIGRLFYYCSNLVEVNISKMNSSNVTVDMRSMFYGCTNLRTIYSDDSVFVIPEELEKGGSSMFTDCTNLVGGYGTTYSSSKTDYTMAHCDVPDNPGYFTDINAFIKNYTLDEVMDIIDAGEAEN